MKPPFTARGEPALHANLFGLDRQHAGFGRHHHEAIGRDQIAAGSQAVAIKLRADDAAVGEDHGGGSVPRFHQRRVILVEGLNVVRHRGVVLPCLGNQHGHHMRQAAACQREQLDGVVKHGRITAAGCDNRQKLLDVIAEQRRSEHGLARIHPVHVAAQRVYFAVVADVAIRVRKLPARKRVRRKALVDDADRARQVGMRELLVEGRNLRRQQQALVNDSARRERRNVEKVFLFQVGLADDQLYLLAQNVELALERVLIHALSAANENLLDVRLRVARQTANGVAVDRRVAPTENGQAQLLRGLFDNAFAEHALLRIDGQKDHAHAIFARCGQREAQLGAFALEKSVRNLDQDAGAVARLRIAPASAAMGQIDQDLDALEDDVVRFVALDVGDESDATPVVLILGGIKPLSLGWLQKGVVGLGLRRFPHRRIALSLIRLGADRVR